MSTDTPCRFAAMAAGLRAAGQEAILAEEAAAAEAAEEAELEAIAAAEAAELEGLIIDEFGGASFVSLEELMDRFVALHAGRHRQRTAGWLAKKAASIGGSEIAALMGYNPYSSFDEVVASKVGVRAFTGNIACQWGTMFESAIERFVEIDCGTRLAGTDISVPSPAHSGLKGRHANSPDGYGVITLFAPRCDETPEGEPVWRILSTDAATRAAAEGRPTKRVIALLEFKCPYRRQPKGEIPKHYKPQLWSGLALSPIAHLGVFVDAAFRKCALWNLGPETGYDWTYHRERKIAHWGVPVAWGLTGIYAPRLDAPVENSELADDSSELADDDADLEEVSTGAPPINAAYEAWHLHYKNFGIPFESPQEAARAGRPFAPDPIDFGDCEKSVFETMMLHLDKKRFRAEHFGPCFPDGRGAALRTGREISAAIDGLAARAPAHHYLLGVIPWKIFEVDYSFIERREDFLAEIAPLVHKCLDMADRFRAEEDPARAYYTYLEGERQARWASGSKKKQGGPDVTVDQVQDLFDAL